MTNAMIKKEQRKVVRAFMQQHYTDGMLAALLAHMRDGKFSFFSCCCFIGIPTADHPLQSRSMYGAAQHYHRAHRLRGASQAEDALAKVAEANNDDETMGQRDARVYTFLLPIVRAEMRRRDRVSQLTIAEPIAEVEYATR